MKSAAGAASAAPAVPVKKVPLQSRRRDTALLSFGEEAEMEEAAAVKATKGSSAAAPAPALVTAPALVHLLLPPLAATGVPSSRCWHHIRIPPSTSCALNAGVSLKSSHELLRNDPTLSAAPAVEVKDGGPGARVGPRVHLCEGVGCAVPPP